MSASHFLQCNIPVPVLRRTVPADATGVLASGVSVGAPPIPVPRQSVPAKIFSVAVDLATGVSHTQPEMDMFLLSIFIGQHNINQT